MKSDITYHINQRIGAKMHQAFEVHMLNEKGKVSALQIATLFNNLLSDLDGLCQDGREKAIMTTKLEEACFFAKKAMVKNPANVVKEVPYNKPNM